MTVGAALKQFAVVGVHGSRRRFDLRAACAIFSSSRSTHAPVGLSAYGLAIVEERCIVAVDR